MHARNIFKHQTASSIVQFTNVLQIRGHDQSLFRDGTGLLRQLPHREGGCVREDMTEREKETRQAWAPWPVTDVHNKRTYIDQIGESNNGYAGNSPRPVMNY